MGNRWIIILSILLFLPGVFPSTAAAAPNAYITERVSANYFTNGTLDGNISRIGYVEVSVGNINDVLQYVRLELDSTAGTNLQSNMTYNSVAASPLTPSDRTRMFLNTTDSGEDIGYRITDTDITPVINLRLDYQNAVGKEINGSNVFSFSLTLTLNYTQSLNAGLAFQIARDTFGLNDSMNLFNVSATSGSSVIQDTDSDGFYDQIIWNGSLTPGTDVIVSFKGNVAPGINFNENDGYVDLNGEVRATNSSTSTFTGITFSDRFSRGPIRQGIELMKSGATWNVRGFIRNIATGLDYIISKWALYEIGDFQNPVINSTTGYPKILAPGDVEYTNRTDTGSAEKKYYAALFDWKVRWGDSNYSRQSESKIQLPILYVIDSFLNKYVSIVSNGASGRTLSVTDEVWHIGHSNVIVNDIEMNSTIPHRSQAGTPSLWVISDVQVNYVNNTGSYNITSSTSRIINNPTGISDGYVFINITDIQSILGHGMMMNDYIALTYRISSASSPSNQNFSFGLTSTLKTLSGTPITKNITEYVVIPGFERPPPPEPPGAGGPGVVPSLYADIVKLRGDAFFITEDMVSITVLDRIIDTGDKGIRDIKIGIFIPRGGRLEQSRLSLRLYSKATNTWEAMERNENFTITDKGLVFIGEKEFREYLIEKKSVGEPYAQTLDLYDEDRIEISYAAKIPLGISYILTRVFGYNFYEDKIIFEDVYIPVRREGALEKFDVSEGGWEQGRTVVGKPVIWTKEFEIYNPNNVSFEDVLTIPIFSDTLAAFLSDSSGYKSLNLERDEETHINWILRLGAKERKTYSILTITPPVLETRFATDVISHNETEARFIINMTLKNFALETYSNVSLLLPIDEENIISIENGVGFAGYDRRTEILISQMLGGQEKNISVTYKETPPILITYLNSLEYTRNETVNLTIIVIPAEREEGPYLEIEVIGPDPALATVYIDLIEIGELYKEREMMFYKTFSLSSLPSGRYFVDTRFKRDFGTIISDQQELLVMQPQIPTITIGWEIIVLIALILVVFVILRVYKRRSYKKEIEELKKEVEKL